MRRTAASSLHEAFKITADDEDTKDLRKCLFNYLVEDQKEIIMAINSNLEILIEEYGNQHTIDHFHEEARYVPPAMLKKKGKGEENKEQAAPSKFETK